MSIRTILLPVALMSHVAVMSSCQTAAISRPSLNAVDVAHHKIDAAYNRADEEALRAQHEADEAIDLIIAKANAQIEAVHQEALIRAEEAYLKAESIERAVAADLAQTGTKEITSKPPLHGSSDDVAVYWEGEEPGFDLADSEMNGRNSSFK